jgi:tetratricopeptide (TPR) repeat protein
MMLALTVVLLSLATILIAREQAVTRAALDVVQHQKRQAELQRQRSAQNLVRALSGLVSLLHEVPYGQGSPTPESIAWRQEISSRVLRVIRGFIAENANDPTLRAETVDAYIHVGNVFELQRDHVQARESYRTAIELAKASLETNPQDAVAWCQLGQGHNILGYEIMNFSPEENASGEFRAAFRAYEEAVRVSPEDPRALNYLAWFLAICPDSRLRNPERAIEIARLAVAQQPDHCSLWGTLGTAYYRAGSSKDAIETLERATQLDFPGKDPCYDGFFLAMAYWQVGRREEALRQFERADSWMKKNNPWHRELVRIRAEAEDLMKSNPSLIRVGRSTSSANRGRILGDGQQPAPTTSPSRSPP